MLGLSFSPAIPYSLALVNSLGRAVSPFLLVAVRAAFIGILDFE